ncbi:MAG: aminotransferase class IV [Planctomycetota bacterium]
MTRWAYFNGEWIDDRELAIPVGDTGFALGVTVTERLRTFDGKPFRQAEHIARMRRSLEIVGMQADEIAGELDAGIAMFLEKNASLFEPGDDWAVVAFATPGVGGVPTRCVHGFPLTFGGWAHQFAQGVPLYVSDHRQTPANCWPPELKCRSRMHYYLADQQAARREPGARAVLIDQDGFVGEASTANIVAYRHGEGVVSPRMEKVLPGVSVAVTKSLCETLGVPFVERDLTLDELRMASEVWLSSTSICLLPATRLDGRPIGDGTVGPLYRKVLAAWNDHVGLDIAEQAVRQAMSREA